MTEVEDLYERPVPKEDFSREIARWHSAIRALRYADKSAIDAIDIITKRKDIVPLKYIMSLSNDFHIRRHAYNAVGEIGNDEAVDVFIEIIEGKGGSDHFNRASWMESSAMKVLEINSSYAIESLIKVIETRIEDAYNVGYDVLTGCVFIAINLAKLGYEQGIDFLIESLNYSSELGQKIKRIGRWNKIITALGQIGNNRAVEMLTHILDDGWCYDLHLEDEDLSEYDITFPSFSHSDETRLQAAIALGQIGGSDALESLMRTLESWHLSTRERGMKGLLETNDMQAIPMIKELLEQTPYPDIRSSMEKTLRDLERKFEIL